MSLVEVRLRSCLAIKLLDVVRGDVEQVAVVSFLIRCGESSKDENMFVGDLIEAASFKTDPIRVLFYP